MWERDLKGFADDYSFVSLQFVSEATESVVPEEATTAKVNKLILIIKFEFVFYYFISHFNFHKLPFYSYFLLYCLHYIFALSLFWTNLFSTSRISFFSGTIVHFHQIFYYLFFSLLLYFFSLFVTLTYTLSYAYKHHISTSLLFVRTNITDYPWIFLFYHSLFW